MKRLLIGAGALLALVACSKDVSETGSPEMGPLQTITVNVARFGNDTRTAVSPSGGFTWSEGDQIGIYPVSTTIGAGQTSQQIVFKINGTGDASSATFTGTGWGLITNGNYKYFSYYPYSAEAKYNETMVSYAENLSQAANGSTTHLGCNDYLYAPQIQPEDISSAVFSFYHLSALVEFEIAVPNEAKTKTFTRMQVVAPSALFTVTGKYNPSSAMTSAAPTITESVYTDIQTLQFNNCAGFTPDENGKIHAYFMIAPAAVSGQELCIKLWANDGKAYIGSKIPSNDIVAQDYRKYNCSVTEKPTETAEDLSANGTANCYIVPEFGKYKFLANVRGNGVDPVAGDSEGPAIDLTNCYPEVIWETINTGTAPEVGTIVSASSVEVDGNYIVFTATGNQGNALIALKNGSDQIVWSWHIWSTNADIEALKQTYPNNAGVFMDRNLGALSATAGDPLTVGFVYQWGRPFPNTTAYGLTKTDRMATTNSSIWVEEATDESKGTVQYSSANPTHFMYSVSDNHLQTNLFNSGNWFWVQSLTAHPTFWNNTKTMYDPCPVGWKIPNKTVWETAGFSLDNFVYNSEEYGSTHSVSHAYYPRVRYRGYNSGTDAIVVDSNNFRGTYWSCAHSAGSTDAFSFCFNETIVGTQGTYRACGRSIRPCKE